MHAFGGDRAWDEGNGGDSFNIKQGHLLVPLQKHSLQSVRLQSLGLGETGTGHEEAQCVRIKEPSLSSAVIFLQ